MQEYNHKNIEEKWQKHWKEEGLFRTEEDPQKPKSYVLDMFPYPSGDGLHVGHPKGYIATDIYSRYKRMTGHNVLHPMGWDAFGLPAEQYAIKNKIHPRIAVEKNTTRFKEQLARIGFNYDWEREINTTDPKYYKWTQWIFLQLYKKGLAYESFEPINWCPTCQTGLANEDLEGGKCERCGTLVEKRPMRQWTLRITEYADRMLSDLDALDWPESIKESQRNWIGRSEGAEIEFPLSGISGQDDGKHKVKVFTTRPDTLFGATYIAISAELAQKWLSVGWSADKEVKEFIAETLAEEKERAFDFAEVAEKKGIATGIFALNPANQEKIPVWIANYVLSGYGTGAIMAVPAHDKRDFAFARKYTLPIRMVICPNYPSPNCPILDEAYEGAGTLVESGTFAGTKAEEAKKNIVEFVGGKLAKQYRLKDWVFSRQRYWGEPIPIVHCAKDGIVPVPEAALPVVLPDVESYAPTGTGESPLADIAEWVNTTCPKCGGPAKRETNTMPQWAGSSWYYLRYIDPDNDVALVDKIKEKYWSPVDMYVGGAEHATRHLIYARFWHKFLYDIGAVNTTEPFKRLQNVGLIMASDGRKMSKRYGNVINPDDIVDTFGADSLRIYEMFMGPFNQSIAWSTDNMMGARRLIEKIWRMQEKVGSEAVLDKSTETLLHLSIKKIGEDIEQFAFNTAISQIMILSNHLEKLEQIPRDVFERIILLLAPFAPHVAEELWSILGRATPLYHESWPTYDPDKIFSETVTIAIQINGKLRDTIESVRSVTNEEIMKIALERPIVKKWIKNNEPKKVIYIPGKILNIVL
jgi:leucyl-tRNA synthetase